MPPIYATGHISTTGDHWLIHADPSVYVLSSSFGHTNDSFPVLSAAHVQLQTIKRSARLVRRPISPFYTLYSHYATVIISPSTLAFYSRLTYNVNLITSERSAGGMISNTNFISFH